MSTIHRQNKKRKNKAFQKAKLKAWGHIVFMSLAQWFEHPCIFCKKPVRKIDFLMEKAVTSHYQGEPCHEKCWKASGL